MAEPVELKELRDLLDELKELVDTANPVPDAAFQLQWNLKVAQWRGMTVVALEDINKALEKHYEATNSLKDGVAELERRFVEKLGTAERDLGNRITSVQVKAAGVSALVTVLVSLAVQLILFYVTR